MPVMATMFLELFYSQCSVCLGKRFSLFLQHHEIAKAKKRAFLFKREPKNSMLSMQCTVALHGHRIVAILLVNARKSLKFHCLESVQNLVS